MEVRPTKEEQVDIIMKRITTEEHVSTGGGQGAYVSKTVVSPKKLAEFLLENIETIYHGSGGGGAGDRKPAGGAGK